MPDNAFELLDDFFKNEENNICRFLLGFDVDHWLLDLCASFSKYDSIFTRFGDSAIIVRKLFFEKLGGFPESSAFEDVEFFKHAANHLRGKSISILPAKVISSARRFIQNGPIKQKLINSYLFAGYFLKVKPESITCFYNKRQNQKKRASLIIFLRYPQIGKVKTRLAETTSNEFALHFYRECANKITAEIKKVSQINKYIFYSNKNEKEDVKNWLGKSLYYSSQDENDLGLRMKKSFQKVFSHGAEKVIIVGSDIPDLSNEIINDAINKLDQADVVIGPSKDGGYYLLGMKKMHNSLFEDIEFSTSSVLSQTISKIEKLGLRCSLLQELQDIDTENELIQWLNNNSNSIIKKEIDMVYNLTKGKVRQKCAHCAQ